MALCTHFKVLNADTIKEDIILQMGSPAMARKHAFNYFLAAGSKFIIVASVLATFAPTGNAAPYDNIVKKMDQLQSQNQELISRFELGTNDQNQMIYGWRFENDGVRAPQKGPVADKSKMLVVGVHHGNEQLSADVAVQFAADLVKDMTQTGLPNFPNISNRVFYVIPVLNIGGYNAGRREEYNRAGRSIDPNRDYPDPCYSGPTFTLASTRNLAAFMRTEGIVGSITIHGYIGTFTFPWGIFTDNTRTQDHTFYTNAAREAVKHNGYEIGTHADAIYPTAGAYEDWAYFEMGAWTMLLELRRGANVVKDSKAMMSFFTQVPHERSFNNVHLGQCRQTEGVIRARP